MLFTILWKRNNLSLVWYYNEQGIFMFECVLPCTDEIK